MKREQAILALKEKINQYESDKRLKAAIETLIPELKESEDERIRMALIKLMTVAGERYVMSATGFEKERLLAYLKQKEQKPFNVCEQCPYYKDCPDYNEQKQDSRDADDLQLLGFIYDLLNEIEWKENWAMSKDECLRRLNNYRPQKPAEWSDEDEKFAYFVNQFLGYHESSDPTAKSCKKWFNNRLKSLHPQPKVEWSEENEEKLNIISEIIEHCTTIPYSGGTLTLSKEYKKELQCFIKSLRPSWKPNDEDEVRLIKTSISFLKDFADKGYENAVECIDWLKSKLNGNTCK